MSATPKMSNKAPFGQADCESEMKVLKSNYSDLYFDETPFNAAAVDPGTYLVIGRRGSGKTALAQYFSFQKTLQRPIYIDVDEPAVYQQVLSDIATHASEAREIAIPRLKRVWEYALWCVIFEHTRDHSETIAQACQEKCPATHPSGLINIVIERLLDFFRGSDGSFIDQKIEKILGDETLKGARQEALSIAADRPIIIALDTLERYDVTNAALMNAMAALIQFAADFNLAFRDQGIHLKVFMSGEVFPFLLEEVIQNPLKHVKYPVYLFWRPKDLLRLICWRFHRFLELRDLLKPESKASIDWTNHRQVLERMWRPYFGKYVTNSRGLREHSFSYVLRHTQMRPRQLILLCNSIAEQARNTGTFPVFSEQDIRRGVKKLEGDLAVEIISSFSALYPKVSTIVDALMKMPMYFKGNELDRRASQSATEWPDETYSPAGFRRLVAELGIVGRVRRHNEKAGYIDADFEYSLPSRLVLTHRDECVIHPMFYTRFNVDFNCPSRVIPFSTERETQEDDDTFW
jgi:hypothetical protein